MWAGCFVILQRAVISNLLKPPPAKEEPRASLRSTLNVMCNWLRQLDAMIVPVDTSDPIINGWTLDRLTCETSDANYYWCSCGYWVLDIIVSCIHSFNPLKYDSYMLAAMAFPSLIVMHVAILNVHPLQVMLFCASWKCEAEKCPSSTTVHSNNNELFLRQLEIVIRDFPLAKEIRVRSKIIHLLVVHCRSQPPWNDSFIRSTHSHTLLHNAHSLNCAMRNDIKVRCNFEVNGGAAPKR